MIHHVHAEKNTICINLIIFHTEHIKLFHVHSVASMSDVP
jgi:hypothetical protein